MMIRAIRTDRGRGRDCFIVGVADKDYAVVAYDDGYEPDLLKLVCVRLEYLRVPRSRISLMHGAPVATTEEAK